MRAGTQLDGALWIGSSSQLGKRINTLRKMFDKVEVVRAYSVTVRDSENLFAKREHIIAALQANHQELHIKAGGTTFIYQDDPAVIDVVQSAAELFNMHEEKEIVF